jgi:site-specific DNA-adenine methylase
VHREEAVTTLTAPFPWFGGKSRVAPLVWDRFGNVPNYVEPFAGSLAVLLARPYAPKTETVNDIDHYLANFWRAVKAHPEAVATEANWPVNEADILARHAWLAAQLPALIERMRADAEYFNARVAGWWVWGVSAWIGSGWCRVRGGGHQPEQLPHLGDAGMGINRKLPHLGDAGREASVGTLLAALRDRLRNVRVACGEWDRVLGPSVTFKHGITGVFLDPPYGDDEHSVEYATRSTGVAEAARTWALENGDNPLLRISLCGYEGEHDIPNAWECVAWKARGGYGSQADGAGRENSKRERIWFSPHCLKRRLIA